MHAREVHDHETHAYEIHALEMHAQKVLGKPPRSLTLQTAARWSICRDLSCKIQVFALRDKRSLWASAGLRTLPPPNRLQVNRGTCRYKNPRRPHPPPRASRVSHHPRGNGSACAEYQRAFIESRLWRNASRAKEQHAAGTSRWWLKGCFCLSSLRTTYTALFITFDSKLEIQATCWLLIYRISCV
jgi:hypothetical protein